MYVLTANITIFSEKTWTFEKVQSVTIVRDTETLTDICTIMLPRKVKWKDEPKLPIQIGDSILVRLGYNGKTQTVFCGYITSISAKGPLEIKCEDEMLLLKQMPVNTNLSFYKTTVGKLLADQLPDMQIKVCGNDALGAYRVPSKTHTVSQLLAGLRTAGFKSFFRYDKDNKPTLYCGATFDAVGERVQVFDNALNIINSDKLVFEHTQAEKILVKGVSTSSLNKDIIEMQVGEEGGSVDILIFHRKTEAEVKARNDINVPPASYPPHHNRLRAAP